MAGSYQHILHGISMIENMGDAAEAIEELMWLVQKEIGTKKAKNLLDKKYYPMLSGEKEHDKHFVFVRKLMGK